MPGTTLSSLLLVLLGLVMAFFGYRLLKFFLGVAGFALGFYLGWYLLFQLGVTTQLILLIGALVLGFVGAGLAFPLYLVGVFALGAASAILLLQAIAADAGLPGILVAGLAGGILALLLQKPLLVLITALDGAYLALAGGSALLRPYGHGGGYPLSGPPHDGLLPWPPHAPFLHADRSLFFWLALAILALLAAVFQFRERGSPAGVRPDDGR